MRPPILKWNAGMATYTTERVLDVRHWSDKLFSFVTTRGRGLRFENGQFVMLGLPVDGKNIVRAYSIASANYEDHLEFFSIKVPHGPLTSRLQHIEIDSQVLVSCKPTGTLVLRDVRPGKRLFMLATGTGVAPFLALAKDPQTYESFEQVDIGARRTHQGGFGVPGFRAGSAARGCRSRRDRQRPTAGLSLRHARVLPARWPGHDAA